MKGFIVYSNSDYSIKAKFQGGSQTAQEIITLNNFIDCTCHVVEIKNEHTIDHYDLDSKGNIIFNKLSDINLKTLRDRRKIKENELLIDYFISEINNLRRLLSLPTINKSSVLDYIKNK